MKTYNVDFYKEVWGTATVNAENEDKAREMVERGEGILSTNTQEVEVDTFDCDVIDADVIDVARPIPVDDESEA